jgi:hypothetical protein
VQRWGVAVLFALAWLAAGCHTPEKPGLVATRSLLAMLQAEWEKPPAEQDRERVSELLATLDRDLAEEESARANQRRLIEDLQKRLAKQAPTGEPPLLLGPYVVQVQFSFDTRAPDIDDDGVADVLDVTIWPKDRSGDTVKAVGTMKFVLSRQPLFQGTRGEVLQTWFEWPQNLDKAWASGTVFGGHQFQLKLNDAARQARRVILELSYISPDGRELTAKKAFKL